MMVDLQEDCTTFKRNLLRVAIEKGYYARNCPKQRVRDSKHFMEQMLLAKKDEARVILSNEQNDLDKIRALEKERDDLQLNTLEQRKHLLELQNVQNVLKRKMNANEDKYLDDVLNLEAKLKKNENMVMKMSNSVQAFYKVHVNVCDIEEILEDAAKSQIKMENKLKDPIAIKKKQKFRSIDYEKLNALYETFVPQEELFAEQKYFSSVSMTSETSSNTSTSSPPPVTMPSLSKPMKHFHQMEIEFKKLFTILEISSTPKSISFKSREDKLLHDFCCNEVKPIFNDLHSFFKILQKEFPEEVKTMMDVFELMESDLDATWKQNEILNDQLLEATLKHEIEKCVLMCNDFVNDNLLDEIEKVKRESIDVQENLQK
ncbi:hypothetical protein Tco_0179944 [Tanacetum coccineum]